MLRYLKQLEVSARSKLEINLWIVLVETLKSTASFESFLCSDVKMTKF